MTWPHGPGVIITLFDIQSGAVSWSGRAPASLESSLESACVREFTASHSISRAVFPHWNPACNSVGGATDSFPTTTITTNSGAILAAAACATSDAQELYLGIFVSPSLANTLTPDVAAAASSVLLTAAPILCPGDDMTSHAAVERLWRLALRRLCSSPRKLAGALMALSEPPTAVPEPQSAEISLIDALWPPQRQGRWFDSCIVFSSKGRNLLLREGPDMSPVRASVLTWHYVHTILPQHRTPEVYEVYDGRRQRAWFVRDALVICCEAIDGARELGDSGRAERVQDADALRDGVRQVLNDSLVRSLGLSIPR